MSLQGVKTGFFYNITHQSKTSVIIIHIEKSESMKVKTRIHNNATIYLYKI